MLSGAFVKKITQKFFLKKNEILELQSRNSEFLVNSLKFSVIKIKIKFPNHVTRKFNFHYKS